MEMSPVEIVFADGHHKVKPRHVPQTITLNVLQNNNVHVYRGVDSAVSAAQCDHSRSATSRRDAGARTSARRPRRTGQRLYGIRGRRIAAPLRDSSVRCPWARGQGTVVFRCCIRKGRFA